MSQQVFYDDKGQPTIVQLSVDSYEKLVNEAKSAKAAKEKIEKTLSMLKEL